MWMYKNHSEAEYKGSMKKVEEIALQLGAELACTKAEKFVTFAGGKKVTEERKLNIFRFNDDFFDVETHYMEDCPFIVLSFGDTPENVFEDAEPFPYNLSDEELLQEVKYSLGIEAYPEKG